MPGPFRRALRRFAVPLAFVACMVPSAMAAPFIPASDAVVLDRVPASADPAEAELRMLTAALDRDRGDRALAVRVARLDIARGQLLADPRYYGRAEAALAPWAGADDPPADVRLLRAILRQSAHVFDAALDDLTQVLDAEPRNGQARLTRAVIRLVRADYAAARDDCAALAGAAPAAAMQACVAAVAGITGHAQAGLAMLTVIAADPGTPPAILVWALTLAGEIVAGLGDAGAALAIFEHARLVAPDDVYLLAAYADALMEAGRDGDVIALLADRSRADALLLRLAEAEQRLGRPDPSHVSDLAARFETSRRRGETFHQREEARFALHLLARPGDALRLAQANWQVQRERADARILLEAALAAGAPAAAAPVLAWRHDNTVEDAPLARLAARLAATVP